MVYAAALRSVDIHQNHAGAGAETNRCFAGLRTLRAAISAESDPGFIQLAYGETMSEIIFVLASDLAQ